MWQSMLLLAVIAALVVMGKLMERRWNRPARKSRDQLDQPLVWWSNQDALTVRDLLNGGIAIFGRSGSGKTSSSGRAIAQAVLRYPRSGGLIVAAKPEDRAFWAGLFKAAGRENDLILFGPGHDRRFNFLAYVLGMGGHTREVTRCLTLINETLRSSDTRGGENADFFEKEQERMIFNAVEVVKLASGSVSAPDIQKFITTAPLNAAQIATPEWQAGFCNQCIAAAFCKPKTPIEAHDFQLAADYWLTEYPNMADKTRSSIQTGVMGLLHAFNMGAVRELVSTDTNVSPDDMLAGKWVLVNMPAAEWGDSGSLVAAGWKYLTQRRILRREAKDEDCINVIWVDEAQTAVNSYDAHYLAQCRSHKGCMVYLTQSIHSYYSAMHGDKGRHQADALLTNFAAAKIFHALGDAQTAEWASGMLGKERQVFVAGSMQPVENLWDEAMGRGKVTTNTSEHYSEVLQPNTFMNGLRTGGRQNGLLCDAVVVRSGEPYAHGTNWLWVTFSQQG